MDYGSELYSNFDTTCEIESFPSLLCFLMPREKTENRRGKKNSFRFVIWLRRLICVRKEGWKNSLLFFSLPRNIVEYRCKRCFRSFRWFTLRCVARAILEFFSRNSYFDVIIRIFLFFLFLRDPSLWSQCGKKFSLIRISPDDLVVGTFMIWNSYSSKFNVVIVPQLILYYSPT